MRKFIVYMKEKAFTLEALFFVTIAWLCIFFLSFRRLAGWLGAIHSETLLDESARSDHLLRKINKRVNQVSDRTWWKSECFVRASAVAWMLRRRGYGYTLYLGVGRDEKQTFVAHAWIRSGSRWMSGSRKRNMYTVVATFSCEPDKRRQR